MKRHRNVKIVATLGPASSSYEMIRALVEAGADVFRLNMSHGTQAEQLARYELIRKVEDDLGVPLGVLADLQGPKLRVGTFANGSEELVEGQAFRLDLDPTPGDATRAQLPHREIFEALEVNTSLLVNDGKIRLKVVECGPDFANCIVTVPGVISNRKGVNVPDVLLPLAALSDKDRSDLEFACEFGADWIALSFVQRPEDMLEARALVKGRAAILAKIEKPSAVKFFDEILAESDGIMVARGDLGVELPVASVPPIQKQLITKCRAAAKPVIVATQMLESMIESPMPTRAEVSDVANAIYEGADAVMLSAESAAGRYPIEAVRTMDDVASSVESDPHYREQMEKNTVSRSTVAEGMVAAAREIADTTDIKAICCYSRSGRTANLVARERPRTPIIVLTPLLRSARRLCLTWGTICRLTDHVGELKFAVSAAVRATLAENLATPEDHIAVLAGVPFNTVGSTNVLRVAPCDERLVFGTEMSA